MNVELVDHMGSDVSVVNAARVSYGKQVTAMSTSDRKLLKYLATHKHWTPFAHPQLSFRSGHPSLWRASCSGIPWGWRSMRQVGGT